MSKRNKPWPCMDCRMMMLLVDDDHCKCPVCGTEVWFDYNDELTHDEVNELMKDNLAKHQRSVYDAMIGGEPVKGGGSRNSKGKSRKQAMQKPSTTELYKRLSKS